IDAKITLKLTQRNNATLKITKISEKNTFPMPTHHIKKHPTRQPIATDLWKTDRGPKRAAVFTSVANWSTSGLKDITWRRRKYLWSKSRGFLRFVAAPKKAGETFELATNIQDRKTRAKFDRNGWRFT